MTPELKTPLDSTFVSQLNGPNQTGYLIDLIQGSNDAYAEVVVYEAVNFTDGIQLQDNSGVGGSWTPHRDDAYPYLAGDIKWDGCSNWTIHPTDNCMLHLCGKESITELAWLLNEIYDFAAETMNWTECH